MNKTEKSAFIVKNLDRKSDFAYFALTAAALAAKWSKTKITQCVSYDSGRKLI